MKKLLVIVGIGCLPLSAHAAAPTISNVSGTIGAGQTLTITGANLVQENKANWDWTFSSYPRMYGFESTTSAVTTTYTDGYVLGPNSPPSGYSESVYNNCVYDGSLKLAGDKSLKCRVVGGGVNAIPNDGGSAVSFDANSTNGSFYFRFYTRWHAVNNVWPDNYMKLIFTQGGSNQWYWDVAGGGSNWYWKSSASEAGYPPIAGGGLQNDRWYLIEGQWTNSPRTMKVWVDNVLTYDGVPSQPFGNSWSSIGIINYNSKSKAVDITNYIDNFAFSPSGRIYPSTVVEISGDGGATWKYQPPVSVGSSAAMSDTQLTVSAVLPALTASNYLLRVTNNMQQTSTTYNLGGAGKATLPAPTGLKVIQVN
jgi:hypothetical protein